MTFVNVDVIGEVAVVVKTIVGHCDYAAVLTGVFALLVVKYYHGRNAPVV